MSHSRFEASRLRRSGALLAALGLGAGLSACGSTSSTSPPKQTIAKAVASLTAERSAQFTVTVSANALPSSASGVITNVKQFVDGLSLVVDASATGSGATLGSKDASSAVSVVLDYDGTPMLQVRAIGSGKAYLYLDTSSWSKLPIRVPAADRSTLREAEGFLGNHWFSLPLGALGAGASTRASGASATTSGLSKLWSELEASATVSQSSANGETTTTVTGPLSTLVNDVLPEAQKIAQSLGQGGRIPTSLGIPATGNYTVRLLSTDPGSVLTHLEFGVASIGELDVSVGHAPIVVTAPSGASPLPSQVLGQLGTLA